MEAGKWYIVRNKNIEESFTFRYGDDDVHYDVILDTEIGASYMERCRNNFIKKSRHHVYEQTEYLDPIELNEFGIKEHLKRCAEYKGFTKEAKFYPLGYEHVDGHVCRVSGVMHYVQAKKGKKDRLFDEWDNKIYSGGEWAILIKDGQEA